MNGVSELEGPWMSFLEGAVRWGYLLWTVTALRVEPGPGADLALGVFPEQAS